MIMRGNILGWKTIFKLIFDKQIIFIIHLKKKKATNKTKNQQLSPK